VFSGLGAAPSKYWADPRVKAMQAQLNTMLAASSCSTKLGTDGLIGPGTCGALAWAKAAGAPPAAYTAAAADMEAGCKPFALKAPACPAGAAPVAPAPVTADTPLTRPPSIPSSDPLAPAATVVAVPPSPSMVPAPASMTPAAAPMAAAKALPSWVLIGGAVVAIGLGALVLSKRKAA
jgi:hypothetical protein